MKVYAENFLCEKIGNQIKMESDIVHLLSLLKCVPVNALFDWRVTGHSECADRNVARVHEFLDNPLSKLETKESTFSGVIVIE